MDNGQLEGAMKELASRADGLADPPRHLVARARARMFRNVAMSGVSVVALIGFGAAAIGRVTGGETAPPRPPAARVSTDGQIAFLSDRAEGYGQRIFVVEPDGTELREVSGGFGYSSSVDASFDGKEFVYERGLAEGRGSLVVVDAGSGKEDVVYSDEGSDTPLLPQGPAFSPDGTRIAFYSGKGRIYVINRDGSGMRQLTEPDPTCGDFYPAWSPDGTQIAYTHDCPGGGIFVTPANGGESVRVTQGQQDLEPAWSPDGSRIAFTRAGQGGRKILAINLATGTEMQLAEQFSYSPSWSPDGTSIAFTSERDGTPDIWVMASDGSGQRSVAQGKHDDFSPVWFLTVP